MTLVQNIQRWAGEQMFTMKSKVVTWPSVMCDGPVLGVGQKMCERWSFTISEFSCQFPQILCILLYKTITISLGCQNFCAKCVSKNTENSLDFDLRLF
jgi:hypothetical protein